MSKWKGAFVARISVGAGGSWARGWTEDEAVAELVKRVKADWKHLFQIEGKHTAALYLDGGTTSFDDDEFLKRVEVDFD